MQDSLHSPLVNTIHPQPYTYSTYFTLETTTVKPVLSGHSKGRPKLVLNTPYRLMQIRVLQNAPLH